MRPCPPAISRRHLLASSLWPLLSEPVQAASTARHELQFPRDLGAHPEFAIEWWYLTGWLRSEGSAPEVGFGFQLTFFRSRVAATQAMTSAFAAKQLIFAHAAVTDLKGQTMLHDQRIAREGFGIAQASQTDTDVKLRNWSLQRSANGYAATAMASGFDFQLQLRETQPLLLQGERGLSRKGPQAGQSSYYYSLPQLQAGGTLRIGERQYSVQGTAWLDHEWSDKLMPAQAVGWDWIGMNLFDGSALTAFRLRDKDGATIWAGGSLRRSGAAARDFGPQEVSFTAQRRWTSTQTRTDYPVEWLVRTPEASYRVKALLENQELDSRASTGAVYWEGLSELFDDTGQLLGRGYLEMTGYANPLRL
jgi:predicted secreted hydrolase